MDVLLFCVAFILVTGTPLGLIMSMFHRRAYPLRDYAKVRFHEHPSERVERQKKTA